jgi:hypothetical protein
MPVSQRVAFAILLLFAACSDRTRRETQALVDAVDAYRHADSASKAARGKAVGEVACSDPQVCAARQICVAAIEPTTQALALKDEVTARIGDIEKGALAPDSGVAQALPGKLDDAERLLRQGRDKMGECDVKLAALSTR